MHSQAELEDLSFAVLYPEEHSRVAAMVRSRQDPEALEATVQAVKAGMEAKGIKYEDISGRPKNLYGIWQKMLKDGVTNVDKVWNLGDDADLTLYYYCTAPVTLFSSTCYFPL